MKIAFVWRSQIFGDDGSSHHTSKALRAERNIDLSVWAFLSARERDAPGLRRPPQSERHRRLIRTGVRACVAHLICEAARAIAADAIGVEPVIPGSDDQRAVAVNIDPIRSRAAPG